MICVDIMSDDGWKKKIKDLEDENKRKQFTIDALKLDLEFREKQIEKLYEEINNLKG